MVSTDLARPQYVVINAELKLASTIQAAQRIESTLDHRETDLSRLGRIGQAKRTPRIRGVL